MEMRELVNQPYRRLRPPRLRRVWALATGIALAGGALLAGGAPPVAAGTIYPVTATIPVGALPVGVGVDTALHTVYVANHNDHTVSVIDEATNRVTATIPVGTLPSAAPNGVAVDPTTHAVYVTNGGSGANAPNLGHTVTVIDGTTGAVTATIPVGNVPDGVAVDPTTHTVYVANSDTSTVSVIREGSNTVVATIPIGALFSSVPRGVAVDPTTHRVYVTRAEGGTGAVSVIDEASNTIVATIPVGLGPTGVAVDPATHTVYVTNDSASSDVSVISEATNTVTATIPVGMGVWGVAVDPATHTVYVTNPNYDEVSVIDEGSNRVTATIPVGAAPTGVAVDPTTHTVYVSNLYDNTVSVITPTADADLAIGHVPDISANATGPDGATLRYTAPTVRDGDDTSPPTPVCTPPSGSVFPIGSTTVTCTATDAADTPSTVSSTFTVTVEGAAGQLNDLAATVDSAGLGPGSSLVHKLARVQSDLSAGDVADACATLGAFVHEVRAQDGHMLTAAQANRLIADATRIEAVLGC